MSWYLIQCKSNQQSRAEANLRNQGFEIYTPHIKAERIVRRQRIIRDEAVFPGYLFIQLDPCSNWRALHGTRGVGKVVSFNGCPKAVSDELIVGLKQQFDAQEAPVALFKAGDKVQITDGCFKDIEAIVKAVTPDQRIVVLLSILHSEQAVTFPVTQLARAG
ncbi:MAG: transcription/translation regulatory transformer protein RfaH [Gammaproteobacteria bacterium]|nr:transcription/translation regulatory transformer protein RfaH [Gammaproteobacteria bacterium]|tara:strand:- start:515 stop:1000 length:486 start_codon:yes stop_codon:yes gene_type:complete